MTTRVLSTMICYDYQLFDFGITGYTVCINSSGEVLQFGETGIEDLNLNDCTQTKLIISPLLTSLESITSVDCGKEHIACLSSYGDVFVIGSNSYGQRGIGPVLTNEPVKVDLPPIQQLSCGSSFTLCLSEDGYLYSFGYNNFGQLGIGPNNLNIKYCQKPQKIESLKDVEFVVCGCTFVFCKTMDNTVYCWGNNTFGQLGIGNLDKKYSPYECLHCPEDVIDIKCGSDHTILLTSNQKIYSCGYNQFGQIGRETDGDCSTLLNRIEDLSEIIRIECGDYYTMCIDIYNRLYVFW